MDASHPSVKPAERIGRSQPAAPIRSPRPLVSTKPSVPAGGPDPVPPRIETRWVPLVAGARAFPVGVNARSGAMMMIATRAEPAARDPSPPTTEIGVRTALVSCVEALLPVLEPGWSDCQEHPSCRAVQEAAAVLWGGTRRPSAGDPDTASDTQ
jgi:hypothetical protein